MSVLDHIKSLYLEHEMSYDLEDVKIQDYRDTTEVVVPNPRLFLHFARGLENKGWDAIDWSDSQRHMIGVMFDSTPTVCVMITLTALDTWSKRYQNGERIATPQMQLRTACDNIISGDGRILDRFHKALVVERKLYPEAK